MNHTRIPWNFDNSYQKLSSKLYSVQNPVPVPEPEIVLFNDALAAELGLEALTGDQETATQVFSGNAIPEETLPISLAYAGHQFGHFTMLGDGRAVLLGEHLAADGRRFDLQLKGSGQTPYSRRGDGRATLSSMLREYLISEAMHHLHIPTTRSLAVASTGQPVYREQTYMGAVLTRVAQSHIRVGTFEYVRRFGTGDELLAFTKYVIDRHYPELAQADNPPLALFKAVMDRQIDLIVDWMRVGFIHGVMNTDNMSIAGETIDYGPCAFMNAYNPLTVFSSIDHQGRYAFGNQRPTAHWNLYIFGGTLLPLLARDQEAAITLGQEVLDSFSDKFEGKWYRMMGNKLGIESVEETDRLLIDDLLELMEAHTADYTNTFIALQSGVLSHESLFEAQTFQEWHERWKRRLTKQGNQEAALERMKAHNPLVIPRNHLVESALQAAVQGDLSPFQELLKTVQNPYQLPSDALPFQAVPAGYDARYKTFCGT